MNKKELESVHCIINYLSPFGRARMLCPAYNPRQSALLWLNILNFHVTVLRHDRNLQYDPLCVAPKRIRQYRQQFYEIVCANPMVYTVVWEILSVLLSDSLKEIGSGEH